MIGCIRGSGISAPRTGQDEGNLSAATLRTDQPRGPIGNGRRCTVFLGKRFGIGLGPMSAGITPYNQLYLSRRSAL